MHDEPLERETEHVLQRLGSAVPPPGMEGRVLARLSTHAAMHRRPMGALHMLRFRVFAPVALAAAACVAGGLILLHGHAPRTALVPAPRLAVAAAETAPQAPSQPAPARHSALRLTTVHRVSKPEPTKELPAWEAPSFPAPPMPLTRQEQLLQEVAARRNPANMRMLNQKVQTAEMARTEKAFAAFFYQPTEEEYEKHAQHTD